MFEQLGVTVWDIITIAPHWVTVGVLCWQANKTQPTRLAIKYVEKATSRDDPEERKKKRETISGFMLVSLGGVMGGWPLIGGGNLTELQGFMWFWIGITGIGVTISGVVLIMRE